MRRLIRLLWAVVVLCLLYALSIGPATILVEKKMISKNSFELIYSPLQKIAKKSNSADKALNSYIGFWKPAEKK